MIFDLVCAAVGVVVGAIIYAALWFSDPGEWRNRPDGWREEHRSVKVLPPLYDQDADR